MHEGGGNCLKYVKGGWNRTERRGHKDFKKGGKLGQGMGTLKRGGGWNPLTNYATQMPIFKLFVIAGVLIEGALSL